MQLSPTSGMFGCCIVWLSILPHTPQTPLAVVSAAGKEGAAQLSPGRLVALRGAGKHRQVQLFSSFSLAWKHSLIIVRSEQLAHFYTYPAPCL